ncbi:MAG: hypothetical protein LAO09_04520 [Acidobacteriia bacterium]|nr:hypothetical protein [Terriglobia bacterium]
MRYAAEMKEGSTESPGKSRIGLCLDCHHVRRIESAKGSTFYRCAVSESDPKFAKYPRLPVLVCSGFKPKA